MIHKRFVKTNDHLVAQVTFTLPAGVWAESIHLVGDFNGWSRTAHPFQRTRDGRWTLTLELEVDRVYRFRYLLDGTEWTNDSHADSYASHSKAGNVSVIITAPELAAVASPA